MHKVCASVPGGEDKVIVLSGETVIVPIEVILPQLPVKVTV